MQIVRQLTVDSTTRLHEIMHDFTLPMRRVCPHLSDDDLRGMIERMARHQLEEELALLAHVRRLAAATPRPRRRSGARCAMTLAS
jgi:hypothetical protein